MSYNEGFRRGLLCSRALAILGPERVEAHKPYACTGAVHQCRARGHNWRGR
jgi:hypothetical protein